jgi:Retrotransposon gag protein
MNLSHSLARIQRNSKHSSSNVNYISKIWTLKMILRRLPLCCPTFGMSLRSGLNLCISGLTDEPMEWFNNWEAFLDELHTNFGPYHRTGDTENKLTNLHMRDNQHVSDYLVCLFGLAICCSWGEPALRCRFLQGFTASDQGWTQ